MNTKSVIAVIVVLVIIAGGWYLYSTGKLTSIVGSGTATSTATIVASVNGQNITYGQLTAAEAQLATQAGVSATSTDPTVKSQLQSGALDSLISLALLQQAAQKAGIVASSTAVDAQVQAAKTQLGGDAAYQQALAKQGITESALRDQIAKNLAVQIYLEQTLNLSQATATDAEISAAYDQVKSQQSDVPPLSQVKDQVKQLVIQQKQQQLISNEVAKLRQGANIQTFI